MVPGTLPCFVGIMPCKACLLRTTRQVAYTNEFGT